MPTVISAGRPALVVARPRGPVGPPGPPGTAGPTGGSGPLAAISPVENIWFPACDITGATNAAATIQAAVNAAEAAGGGIIQLPATGTGKILVNTSVIISKGGIHIRGFGFEEFKGYFYEFTPSRGTTGTYIHTTAAVSPFIVRASASGARISDMAFTQAHPADAPGWAPTVYPPCIDHTMSELPDYASAGSLDVFNVLFGGVYAGIKCGGYGAVGTSDFAARDHFYNIKGTIFSIGIDIRSSSDVCRIENLHIWPGFYDITSLNVRAYTEANATGIISFRNDNGMMNNIFLFGLYYGIRLNGGNPEGITQGLQITNLNCDAVRIGVVIDAHPTAGSNQYAISIVNFSHNGQDPTTLGGFAVLIAANVIDMAVTVVNANWLNFGGPAALIDGTGNELTLINARAFYYAQAGAFTLIHATAGNAAYLYGRIHVAVAGSSPGIGNANVIDNSDGPATTWQAYAPALVFGGGGAGTATGRSKTINHVTFIELSITVTTGGTLTSFSLPKNSFATGLLHGRELAAVGQPWTAITGAGTAAAVRDADNNSAVTAGWLLRFSGSYESV